MRSRGSTSSPNKREHTVADELVRLTARVDHRLRGRLDEPVDQKDDVERQPRLGERG